jgi:transglutaminase-like putative cysteine protease
MTTLVGATSALAVLGLGAVEETDATWEQVQELGLVLVATVLIARLFRFVPEQGIASGPTAGGGGGGDSTTLEASLLTDDDELTVQGSISLSPRVRFSVAARDPRYWHAGTYDRYTGEGWVRTGGTDPYDGQLSPPPGSSRSLVQDVELHSSLATVPAAWRPVAVEHETPVGLAVTDAGTLTPLAAFSEGDSYRVVSETPEWSRDLLREAGTDYPRDLASRYTQLPEGTPDRLAEHAAEVTADADNPYDAAAAVASWLITNKAYSRRITRPEGDVADAFVFRMEQGYCVYFATAMVAMLRTQGVPARFAVGYTPGELEDERWVVRGYNSHAWVDVYFPGFGWVPFDPTPSSPRQAAEQERLGQAREANATDVDPGGAEPEGTPTPTPTPTATESTASGSTANGSTPNENALNDAEIDPGGGNGEVGGLPTATPRGDDQIVAGPSDAGATVTGNATDGADGAAVGDAGGRDRLTLLASAAGIALGAYRFGLVERGFDAVRLRVQRRTDSPDRDAARAFERLELLLAREYRQRREGETPRGYLASLDDEGIDPRSRRVAEIYERAYYGHGVSRDAADEAVDLVDELVDEYGRL